jgi:hypothetical protein
MAERDRLVEFCSNDLPVFVLEKQIEGAYGFCFCCPNLPSMEIICLPCCKASVHRHCVLDSLTTNDQCVYCRQYLDPQDIHDCTPIRMVFSGDACNTTRSQVNAAQESIMSGGALKAPPEATMSQEEVAANMNPPNIHFEPPVPDDMMNMHKTPLDDQERSLSSVSIVDEEDNNGLLFAPTCSTCFNENKYLLVSEKKCSHEWSNESLNNPDNYIVFLSEMYHCGYYNQKSNNFFT